MFKNVLDIDEAIFQDPRPGIVQKGRFFRLAIENYWIFVWENSKISQSGYNFVYY